MEKTLHNMAGVFTVAGLLQGYIVKSQIVGDDLTITFAKDGVADDFFLQMSRDFVERRLHVPVDKWVLAQMCIIHKEFEQRAA